MIAFQQPHIATGIFKRKWNFVLSEETLERQYRRNRSVVYCGSSPIQHDGAQSLCLLHCSISFADGASNVSAATPKLSVMPAPPSPVTTSTPLSGWKRTKGFSKCLA